MTKSKQSLSKKVNLNDFSNAISPLGAVLTFAFCLLFFMLVLQPNSYNTEYTFELTQQLAMGSFSAYQFTCWGTERIYTVLAGIVIGICQFEFLHKKAYLTTLLSFGVKREKLFRHRLLIPLVTSFVVILITELIALGINIEILGVKPELPLAFFSNLLSIFKYFLFSYTVTVISCVFTGRTVEALLSAIAFTAISDIVIMFTKSATMYALYGNPIKSFIGEGSKYLVINPLSGILSGTEVFEGISSNHIPTIISSIIWCAICSVALLVVIKYFKDSYKSEKAGLKGTCKPLLAFVISTFTLFTALAIIFIVESTYYNRKDTYFGLAFILVSAVLVALAIYALIYRNSKKLKTALLGLGIGFIYIIAIFTICLTGIFGTYNKAPELSNIESITISTPFPEFIPETYGGDFTNEYSYGIQQTFTFTDEKDIKLICETHELFSDKDDEQFVSGFNIKYRLKDGKTEERHFWHINSKALEKILPLWNSIEVKSVYKKILFPEVVEIVDDKLDYEDWAFYNELNPVADYDSQAIEISFLSKHGVKTTILSDSKRDLFTERQYIELKNAILKDYNEMTYEEYFTPSTEYFGSLSFRKVDSYYAGDYIIPIIASMKNTVAFLENLPFYNNLISKSNIQRMAVADVDSFIKYYNGDSPIFNAHAPCLSDDHELSAFTLSDSNAPVTMITDKKEMERILEDAYTFYLLGNSGKLVLVEFENGNYMTYGLPE